MKKRQWFIQEDTFVTHAMDDETGEGWPSKKAAERALKSLGWKNAKVVGEDQ